MEQAEKIEPRNEREEESVSKQRRDGVFIAVSRRSTLLRRDEQVDAAPCQHKNPQSQQESAPLGDRGAFLGGPIALATREEHYSTKIEISIRRV